MSRRTIPVAAVGLSFTAGCRGETAFEPIVGTWDAVKLYKGTEDVTEYYLYSGTYDGCEYSSGFMLTVNPDLVGGFFNRYTYACEGEEPVSYAYGGYIAVENNGGTWLIERPEPFLECSIDVDTLDCTVLDPYDYYDDDLRVIFARR